MDDDYYQELKERLREFAEERDWDQFHSPKNLSMALIAETAELIEHFQWLKEEESSLIQGDKLEAVRMELADIQIYLIRIADKLNVDLLDAVEKKITPIGTEQAPAVIEVEEAPKTIAVLPFVDISPEKDQEYFMDGLSEELLNRLSDIQGLKVTARASSFYFRDKNEKPQVIAEELGVHYLLDGSVRRDGEQLRITAQLIDGSDGFYNGHAREDSRSLMNVTFRLPSP